MWQIDTEQTPLPSFGEFIFTPQNGAANDGPPGETIPAGPGRGSRRGSPCNCPMHGMAPYSGSGRPTPSMTTRAEPVQQTRQRSVDAKE